MGQKAAYVHVFSDSREVHEARESIATILIRQKHRLAERRSTRTAALPVFSLLRDFKFPQAPTCANFENKACEGERAPKRQKFDGK